MWIEVFRAGKQTDSSGDTREWTQADLENIVNLYNMQEAEGRHEAPIVVGHPTQNSPAYGWVESLKTRGGKILAKIKQLDSEFRELVNNGRYNRVSIALYPNMLLRHIGFLGAVPPAVKGLKPAQFADAEYSEYELSQTKQESLFTEIEYNAELDNRSNEQYQSYSDAEFGDYVHKRFPIKTEAEVLSSLAIFNKKEVQKKYAESERIVIAARLLQAARANRINLTPQVWQYQEVSLPLEELSRQQLINVLETKDLLTNEEFLDMTDDLIKMLLEWMSETFSEEVATQTAAKIEELKATVQPEEPPAETPEEAAFAEKEAKLQKRIDELERKNRQNEHTQFVESALREGKLIPAQKELVLPLMEATRHAGKLQFSEGGKNIEEDSFNLFKRFIHSYPNIVQMNEFAEQQNVEQKPNSPIINLPANVITSDEDDAEYSQALQYMEEKKKSGTVVSIQDAVKYIRRNR